MSSSGFRRSNFSDAPPGGVSSTNLSTVSPFPLLPVQNMSTAAVVVTGLPFQVNVFTLVSFFAGLEIDHDDVHILRGADGRPTGKAVMFLKNPAIAQGCLSFHRKVFTNTQYYIQVKLVNPMQAMDLIQQGPIPDYSTCILRVRGVPFRAQKEAIAHLFCDFNVMPEMVLMGVEPSGRPSGECFVRLSGPESCKAALNKLNGETMGSRYLEMFPATLDEISKIVTEAEQASQNMESESFNKGGKGYGKWNDVKGESKGSPYGKSGGGMCGCDGSWNSGSKGGGGGWNSDGGGGNGWQSGGGRNNPSSGNQWGGGSNSIGEWNASASCGGCGGGCQNFTGGCTGSGCGSFGGGGCDVGGGGFDAGGCNFGGGGSWSQPSSLSAGPPQRGGATSSPPMPGGTAPCIL